MPQSNGQRIGAGICFNWGKKLNLMRVSKFSRFSAWADLSSASGAASGFLLRDHEVIGKAIGSDFVGLLLSFVGHAGFGGG
jgi:hypothetical protein